METDEMKWVVIDLDGTLMNCKHRVGHAQLGEWDQFHSKLGIDTVYQDVALLLKIMSEYKNITIIALTGRSERYRKATQEWLIANDLNFFADLIMRPDNDFRKDFVYKSDALANFFGGTETAIKSVAFILDDRDTVVEKLRDIGYNVWQVRQSDY